MSSLKETQKYERQKGRTMHMDSYCVSTSCGVLETKLAVKTRLDLTGLTNSRINGELYQANYKVSFKDGRTRLRFELRQ